MKAVLLYWVTSLGVVASFSLWRLETFYKHLLSDDYITLWGWLLVVPGCISVRSVSSEAYLALSQYSARGITLLRFALGRSLVAILVLEVRAKILR